MLCLCVSTQAMVFSNSIFNEIHANQVIQHMSTMSNVRVAKIQKNRHLAISSNTLNALDGSPKI